MFHYIVANWLQFVLSAGVACYGLNFVLTTHRWEVKYQKQRHGDAVKYQQQRHEDAGVVTKMARRRKKFAAAAAIEGPGRL
jgi:D-mannonate dehydratase